MKRRLKEGKEIASRELWKGQVEEIRTIPAKETLLLVRWFWSREDIIDLFDEHGADIPDSMQRYFYYRYYIQPQLTLV